MANSSIYAAFERMWQHVTTAVNKKADANHSHNELYYTETEINTKLDETKTYADNVGLNIKNDLLNGAGDAYDTLKELGGLIDDNKDAIDALREVATNKADKDHNHDDVYETLENAQLKYDTVVASKADKSHTHVWNDLEDKPFGEEVTKTNVIEWNGDTTNRLYVETDTDVAFIGKYYHVSDYVLTLDDMPNGITTVNSSGNTNNMTFTAVKGNYCKLDNDIYYLGTSIFIVYADNVSTTNFMITNSNSKVTFPKKGVYFAEYMRSLTTTDHSSIEISNTKQLDEKYISETIARTEYVDNNFALKSDLDNIDLSSYETKENAQLKYDELQNSKANTSDLTAHTGNTSNPHGVTLSQLGVTATTTELNYMSGVSSNVQTQLNKKAEDYTIEIYNGTGGNPKPVKFLTVNYSTCGSENGVAIKLGMVSGHGNGSSYAFLEDAIIKVTHTGSVSVDNFKYYGASTGTYDGANRYYGDIFWVIDETNKIVDFYCLMGQYARVQMTPWKRVTYSTGGTITQHTSCTVYSSGTKVWANNSEFALMSDLDALNSRLTALEASIVTVHSGSEVPLSTLGEDGDIYIVTD